MNTFNLTGHVSDNSSGKFNVKIILKTPDGTVTTITDEIEYETETLAVASMKESLNKLLDAFKKHGVEIESRRELRVV